MSRGYLPRGSVIIVGNCLGAIFLGGSCPGHNGPRLDGNCPGKLPMGEWFWGILSGGWAVFQWGIVLFPKLPSVYFRFKKLEGMIHTAKKQKQLSISVLKICSKFTGKTPVVTCYFNKAALPLY